MLMREDAVSYEKRKDVDPISVDLNYRGIQDLGTASESKHQQAQNNYICLSAKLPQCIFSVDFADQNQHQISQKQFMEKPQNTDAG